MKKKNTCGWICLPAIAHLQKAPITACSENVPDSQSSAYRRKCYHLFKENVLKKLHISESNFW